MKKDENRYRLVEKIIGDFSFNIHVNAIKNKCNPVMHLRQSTADNVTAE